LAGASGAVGPVDPKKIPLRTAQCPAVDVKVIVTAPLRL